MPPVTFTEEAVQIFVEILLFPQKEFYTNKRVFSQINHYGFVHMNLLRHVTSEKYQLRREEPGPAVTSQRNATLSSIFQRYSKRLDR